MFKAGDHVIVTNAAEGIYLFTVPGSKGVVINTTSDGSCNVQWYELGSKNLNHKRHYILPLKHLTLLNETSGKYSHIINKLHRMEAKRKELGYKVYG
jgi:hypothetical protein